MASRLRRPPPINTPAQFDYTSVVATSERVAWTVDGVFGDRAFDASGAIVPESWVGIADLPFLAEAEQRVLNHCRAFSYVHLIGNFEDFIPIHLAGVLRDDASGDHAQRRALLRFGDEELKHQHLFRTAETRLEDACGHPFGRWFDAAGTRVRKLTSAMLDYSPLARFLIGSHSSGERSGTTSSRSAIAATRAAICSTPTS